MQTLFLIHLLVSTIVSLHTVTSLCPTDCFCLAGYVTCSDLTSIPKEFPADTRSLSITNIDVDEIPAGIFDKLLQVESIEIYQGKIGTIASNAFRSLTNMDLITLNELTIGTIESYAFSNLTDIGTMSIYMSKIETIQRYAFSDLFALDEIKLFMLDIENVESFAITDIEELYHFYFYTNKIGTMQPYAFSNFADVHKLSLYLNTFGHLGCGSIESLVSETYEQSFYSNSVNCSCDLLWIVSDARLNKYMFSNWCQVPNMNEKVYWEDISSDTLQCDFKVVYVCPPANTFALSETALTEPAELTSQTVTKQVSSTYDHLNTVFPSKPTIIETTVLQTEKLGIITKVLKSTMFSEPTAFVYEPTSSDSASTSAVSESTTPVSVSTPSVSESTSPTSESTSYVTVSTSSATGPKSSVSALVSSTSSTFKSTLSVSNSSSFVVHPSRQPETVTPSLSTSKEISFTTGPLSERITTRQTKTTTQKEKARVTDLLLLPNEKVQYRTKPNVMISEETDVIKATGSKSSVSGIVSSTSSAFESTPSVSNSSRSVVQPSRQPNAVTLSLGTSKETSFTTRPSSERKPTRQTETTTQKEKARVTDLLLLPNENVQYRTKPNVVISEETDVIKAVSSSPKRQQPQSVSHNDGASHVSGLTKLCRVVSLLFLTHVIKLIWTF